MPRRPDLIVPIRDRRRRKRYLTLRNFRNASLVALIAFVAITIRSEMRGPAPNEYGRLYERELPRLELAEKPVEVVKEAPVAPVVADQTHADPLLLEPLGREQWLYGDPSQPSSVQPMPRAEASVASGETSVAIVGGADGVAVVQRERRRPVLSGGFGR